MRLIYFIIYIFIGNYLYSQTCVFDGYKVEPLGSSELINNETLSLYRCSDGHQMWLANNDIKKTSEPLIKAIVSKDNVSDSESRFSNLANSKAQVNKIIDSRNKSTKTLSGGLNVVPKNEIVNSSIFPAVKKREIASKKEAQVLKFSSSLNIQKFGLETLLSKKIESDRQYSEKLNNERTELLHLMYTQKKLFENIDQNKFSIKNISSVSYSYIFYVGISIVLTSYLIF